jgi:hypothetical protein
VLILGCSSAPRDTPSTDHTLGETLPVSASAYEKVEPWATERIETVVLTERFARRTFKDPAHPDLWHELIIGTGNNSDKIYAYFNSVPLKELRVAEHDERELRWGLLFAKYAYLAGIPISELKSDLELVQQCKDSAPGFYMGLDPSVSSEGADLRGIHLAVKPLDGKTAVIMGLTSDQWDEIRHAIMRGEKHELYSLFPEPWK